MTLDELRESIAAHMADAKNMIPSGQCAVLFAALDVCEAAVACRAGDIRIEEELFDRVLAFEHALRTAKTLQDKLQLLRGRTQ